MTRYISGPDARNHVTSKDALGTAPLVGRRQARVRVRGRVPELGGTGTSLPLPRVSCFSCFFLGMLNFRA